MADYRIENGGVTLTSPTPFQSIHLGDGLFVDVGWTAKDAGRISVWTNLLHYFREEEDIEMSPGAMDNDRLLNSQNTLLKKTLANLSEKLAEMEFTLKQALPCPHHQSFFRSVQAA